MVKGHLGRLTVYWMCMNHQGMVFILKKVVSTTPPLIEVCMCVCDIQVCMDGLILCFHPSVADTSSKWKVLCIKKFADKPLERDSGRW